MQGIISGCRIALSQAEGDIMVPFLEVSPMTGLWELTSSGQLWTTEPGSQDCPGDPPRQSRGSSRVRKGQQGAYQWPRLLRERKINGF